MHVFGWLIEEINGRPLNFNTLQLLLYLFHAQVLRLAILRDGVYRIIVDRVKDLLWDIDDSVAAVPVHVAVHRWSVAWATLFLACGSFTIVVESSPREGRLTHGGIEHAQGCAHDRLAFRCRHAHSTVCLNRIQVTHSLDCVYPIQGRTESCLPIRLSAFVPNRLLAGLGESLSAHVFAALKEIEELWLRHDHGIIPIEIIRSSPGRGTLSKEITTALSVAILVNDGSWTLTCIHHHGRHRYEIVLLDELLRIDQLKSFIHLRSVLVLVLLRSI